METLTVIKENALKAFNEGSDKDKDFLRNLFGKKAFVTDIIELITTLEDALEYNGETIEQFNKRTEHDECHEKAYKELCAIALALNEGKRMDYSDTKVYKYYPWFNSAGSGSGFSYGDCACAYGFSSVGSRLCVNTSEKAKYMGNQFISIYNRYING